MSALEVRELSVTLKKDRRRIVSGLNFSVREGNSAILLGASGCGKTMTCHALLDLLESKRFLTEGTAVFGGKDLLALSAREKRALYGKEIAYVPQNPMTALDPSVRVGRQMDETLRLHEKRGKRESCERILEALWNTGLADPERVYSSYPHMLSGGMLQRVLIAMAVMLRAGLVIADEPTTALDVVHRNETVDAFRKLRDAGTAVLLVTHDFAAARRFGGDVLIMYEGRILEQGDIREIYKKPETGYTKALIEAAELTGGTGYAAC